MSPSVVLSSGRGYAGIGPQPLLTLGGNSLNDGVTYVVLDEIVIAPPAATWDEIPSYVDGSTYQVNVKVKGTASVDFDVLVLGEDDVSLQANWAALGVWLATGGELTVTDNGTVVLDCLVGSFPLPTLSVANSYLLGRYATASLSLERMT